MKRLASVTLLAFLGTAAVAAIPKHSQALKTQENLFAQQRPTTPSPRPTTTPSPRPTTTPSPRPTTTPSTPN
ncbi:hypothetical protein H6G54_19040 [Anabaena cylindrica FACHB-243]|uniref:Uncharacterized protein n=1 Tax=Anabaena cylindrica (strain ATCC 27899 / PCC 7122) TaxID=272123 RepID=K9ZH48_ANACC|nr:MULTISPECIES: hypothetical protein [Anabaena]AFZ57882.1 hypothetical protein Anacy_2430 [Anabaena cylindrica PCC 7122]MBD2419763.1 hypothetical protein [Anabaena cylindrica FACHB-243]MCM2405577.1 hypothetical protein [Anabaena sp. CCAP 1446/1C]BAY05159.1 hypothetical protein NIES19_44280 [Anabaena cylindrica PCC 7122]